MRNKAREYPRSTVRRLDTLSCNQCANPECDHKLIAKDGETIVSKICHIEAASPKGPRYNPNMTDEERRHYDNLILLCDECHRIIDNKDNEHIYTVKLLKEWKRKHEDKCRQAKLTKDTSILGQAINAIASINFDEDESVKDLNSGNTFNISDKIKYNSIKRYKPIIEEYSVYFGKINNLYSELERQGSFKKEKLLRVIKTLYLKIKGRYLNGIENELETIQNNADNMFEEIEDELYALIDKNIYSDEDIIIGLPIIMVDAFMRCKILEEPK